MLLRCRPVAFVALGVSLLLAAGMVLSTASSAAAHDSIVSATPDADATIGVAPQEISLTHHEKWNGEGYPKRLAGDAIPVSGRLMALADVFDALMSRRVYKAAMSLEATTEIIVDGSGSHFDPDVVAAFLACRDEFAEVAARLADPEV